MTCEFHASMNCEPSWKCCRGIPGIWEVHGTVEAANRIANVYSENCAFRGENISEKFKMVFTLPTGKCCALLHQFPSLPTLPRLGAANGNHNFNYVFFM